jgi:hypothetical protein
MIITDASQLVMLQNVISPKSSANTTASVPNWNTFVGSTNIDTIQTKVITSKKDSKEYTILEGLSSVGVIQLSIDEAKKCLTTKAVKCIWKKSTSMDKQGNYYLNLVLGDKPIGKIVENVEQDAVVPV